MDTLLQDIRLALRRFGKRPGFAATAILTLALGIGANTTVFSAVSAMIFRPLPVVEPERLVFLNAVGKQISIPTLSYPDYKDYRDRATQLAGLFSYRFVPLSLSSADRNARVWGYEATGNYFDVLGVPALIGRTLRPEDDTKPGANPVAVLSYGCWRRRFGGDPGIAGRIVKINGMNYTVLGVMPAGFIGTEMFFSPELWVPMSMQEQIESYRWIDNRDEENIFVAGRVKPGVTKAQAEAELNSIAAALGQEHPAQDAGRQIRISPLGLAGSYLRGPVVGFATVLLAVAGLVLLLACVNLAGLMLARASDRAKEMAILLAIGAGRTRLLRMLLTESLLLALAGGGAGLLIALWVTDLLGGWRLPTDFPLLLDFSIDRRVLAFTAAVSVITAVLSGLAPALAATRPELASAMKGQNLTGRARRFAARDFLVAGQVALSLVLLVGSVLVVRSLREAANVPLGFEPHGAVALAFDLGLEGYDEQRGREFQRRLLEKAGSLPGVESVGLTSRLPLALDRSNNWIFVEGKPVPKASDVPLAPFYYVSPGYFQTMRTRLIAGRHFDQRDRPGPKPVAMVNEAFVSKLLDGGDGLGKRVRFTQTGTWIEIVGVVENGKYDSLGEEPKPAIFLSLTRVYYPGTTLVARTRLAPSEALRELRRTLLDMDPNLSIYSDMSLEEHLNLPLFPAHVAASALGAFGLLAVVLAATGVYGVMAYAVARRTREIGIRMALGATRGNVLGLVLLRTVSLVAIGTAAGAVVALIAGRFFTPLLYGVSPRDPGAYSLAVSLMTLVALFACWSPAARAMRIDPMAALREE
jgi:predicted permease